MIDDIIDLLDVISNLTGDAGRTGELVLEKAHAAFGKMMNALTEMDVTEIPDRIKEAVLRRV